MKAGFTLEGEMPNLHGDDASAKGATVEAATTQVEASNHIKIQKLIPMKIQKLMQRILLQIANV